MAQPSPSINESGDLRDTGDVEAMQFSAAGDIPTGADRPPSPAVAMWHRPPTPFVWQHGHRLLLLDDEQLGWVVAELRFDVERCRYVEVRRAIYLWPREAVGAILSRALASGGAAAEDSARSLRRWLSRYYGISLFPESLPSFLDSPDFPS
jgi:hypothetical protein